MLVSCDQDPGTLGARGSLRLAFRASVCWGGKSGEVSPCIFKVVCKCNLCRCLCFCRQVLPGPMTYPMA